MLALLAVASVLGTIAYLKDEATADNVMTVGNVKISLLEFERTDVETPNDTNSAVVQEFHDNKPLLPAVIAKDFNYTPGATYVDWTQDAVKWQQQNDDDGYTSPIWDPANINNEVDKMVFLKNSGDYGAYVRIYFAFEAGAFTDYDEFRKMIHLNLNETGDWEWEWEKVLATNSQGGKYFIANATYKKELLPGDFTDITLLQIALDPTATNEQVEAFGDTYEVFVNAQGIQSAGFKTPDEALSEGFGEDFPFDDIYIEGVNLYTALHYLNGDAKGTKITSAVDSVTFGKNKDYLSIVNGYEGVYTNVEQESQVKTYYVPSHIRQETDKDGKVVKEIQMYDLYVLADGPIYTPANSSELFAYMDWLINVNTENLDVSKTTNMTGMFYQCYRMTTLDTSNWDMSNVVDMQYMFQDCNCLTSLAVSEWELGNVTNMEGAFVGCSSLAELAVENWNVGNVTNMKNMFRGCKQFTTLAVDNWNVSNVTTFQSFISAYDKDGADQTLKTLNLSNWDTSSATNMRAMFFGCEQIETLDLSGLDVQNVTTMFNMFANCHGLKEIIFTGWDTSKLEIMNGMFNDCKALETIDVSDFDTQNVTDMGQLFENCASLKEIKGLEKWQTTSAVYMFEMFFKCSKLTELNLSSFDMRTVESTYNMFAHNDIDGRLSSLTTIYVGDNWDISDILEIEIGKDYSKSSANMFNNCKLLKGGNGTTYDKNKTDKEYARVDAAGTPGYLTHISAKTADPEQN